MRLVRRLLPVLASVFALTSCAAASSADDDSDEAKQHWNSAEGNPTHATHSIMAEIASATLRAELPEVMIYRDSIIEGANMELHDLVHETHEQLRLELGGNNWAASRPELLWEKARARYRAGDKALAYFYVGIMLHYVQDMGVPAHAFHVIHQADPKEWDHLEVVGFFNFHADMSTRGTADPNLENPVDYIEWSAETARTHFRTAFPGATYHRKFFPKAYSEMNEQHWEFVRRREADCTWATAYTLRSAARALVALEPLPGR